MPPIGKKIATTVVHNVTADPDQGQRVPMTQEEAFLKATEYKHIQAEIKRAQEKLAKVRETLESEVEMFGKPDEKGNIVIQAKSGTNTIKVMKQLRVSTSAVPEIVDVLKAKLDAKTFSKVVQTVELPLHDNIKELAENKIIPMEVLQRCYETKDGYSFIVK